MENEQFDVKTVNVFQSKKYDGSGKAFYLTTIHINDGDREQKLRLYSDQKLDIHVDEVA